MNNLEGDQSSEPSRDLIAELQTKLPGENLAFAGLTLTDQPVEVRRQFLEQYANWLAAESDDPVVLANPRAVAERNIMGACGTCGSSENCQRYFDAWIEAAPEAQHPYFGQHDPGPEAAYALGSLMMARPDYYNPN